MILELAQNAEVWVVLPDGTNVRIDCRGPGGGVVEHWHQGCCQQAMELPRANSDHGLDKDPCSCHSSFVKGNARQSTMSNFFTPHVGDRCSWVLYSDVEPCTVVARTPSTCTVRINKSRLIKPPVMVPGGFAGVIKEPAEWEILDQLEDRTLVFSRRKNGCWKLRGSSANSHGNRLIQGHRKVYDYGF